MTIKRLLVTALGFTVQVQYIYGKMPARMRKWQPSNERDVFRRCLYRLLRARSIITIIMCAQGELSKSHKQHIRTSYNSQNMKFRICHDIVIVCEYMRVFAQIIQQINTMIKWSSNVNKRHMTILACTENLRW